MEGEGKRVGERRREREREWVKDGGRGRESG